MKALVEKSGRVAQVVADGDEFDVAPGLEWRDCADDVTPEWRFVNGEFVAPVVPIEAVQTVVTMRQARLALLQTGMLAQVNAAVAAADEATKITWEFSSEVQRNNALVATLAAALSLTDQQLDDLFSLAATL